MTPDDKAQLSHYYRARDALGLSVTTEMGIAVPVEWAHVYDYSVELGEYEGEFHVPSWEFFEDPHLWTQDPENPQQ